MDDLEKGDKQGHPFRGNQHVAGKGTAAARSEGSAGLADYAVGMPSTSSKSGKGRDGSRTHTNEYSGASHSNAHNARKALEHQGYVTTNKKSYSIGNTKGFYTAEMTHPKTGQTAKVSFTPSLGGRASSLSVEVSTKG